MQQLSRNAFRSKIYFGESSEQTYKTSMIGETTQHAPAQSASTSASKSTKAATVTTAKVNDFVDHRCPPVASYRGSNATHLPYKTKNVATSESQLSLPFSEPVANRSRSPAKDAAVRHSHRSTDVTQHASDAIAVGHGNIFGKGASVTTKGWTRGKFF